MKTKTFFTLIALVTSLNASVLSKQVKNNSLIVYNANIALVHEERELSLKTNDTTITYEDVAQSININSVNVTLPKDVQLFSQQYRYDKLTLHKLLQAHIDKKVTVRLLKNKNEFKKISATLLSFNAQKAIVRTKNSKIISVKTENIIFGNIPSSLITKPSLVWNIKTNHKLKTTMKLDYLVSNINFKSDYILDISKDKGTLKGWISINNHSGKAFKNTSLSLLAGEINQVTNAQPRVYKRAPVTMTADAQAVSHKAVEGYHYYKVPFKVNIANNEKTQIKFLTKNDLTITREYSAFMSNPLYLHGERKVDVTQYVSLKALDIPLPKGVVRIYSKLGEKTLYLGEERLQHTPKNTPLKLKVGTNFDTKVTQSLFKREDNSNNWSVDVTYTLKNASDDKKEVEILIPFNRDTKSKVETDQRYTYKKGSLLSFVVTLPANTTHKFKVHYESKK